jgi:UDP-2-acetamido-3-amino-2,3-dideoxy-glucuronate N-acetyltransferase
MIHPEAKIKGKVWHEQFSNIGNCEIGEGSIVHSHVWIGDGVKIGANVKIQAFSFIPAGVEIKDNCFIGPRVTFTNDKYPPSNGNGWEGTVVKEGASIGAGSVILPGIMIGKNARIGAGSVVTKDIPDGATAYGNPARVK